MRLRLIADFPKTFDLLPFGLVNRTFGLFTEKGSKRYVLTDYYL